jgi:hypothetical protein
VGVRGKGGKTQWWWLIAALCCFFGKRFAVYSGAIFLVDLKLVVSVVVVGIVRTIPEERLRSKRSCGLFRCQPSHIPRTCIYYNSQLLVSKDPYWHCGLPISLPLDNVFRARPARSLLPASCLRPCSCSGRRHLTTRYHPSCFQRKGGWPTRHSQPMPASDSSLSSIELRSDHGLCSIKRSPSPAISFSRPRGMQIEKLHDCILFPQGSHGAVRFYRCENVW